jgi:hypothetical protein
MTWRAILDVLLGHPAPALPELQGRVHLIADDVPTDPDELRLMGPAEVAAHVGCSRQAAQFRIRKAQASSDWSALLAPSKTTSTTAAQAAQRPTGKEGHMATMTREQARQAAIKDVRRNGAAIMAGAIATDQVKAGMAMFAAGVPADVALDALGATVPTGGTFGEMLSASLKSARAAEDAPPTFASPEAAAAAMLAAGRKAGL